MNERGEPMRFKGLGVASVLAGALVLLVNLVAPPKAEASIHEIIAALCRAGGEEVAPKGQNKVDSASFLRAPGQRVPGDRCVGPHEGGAEVRHVGAELEVHLAGFRCDDSRRRSGWRRPRTQSGDRPESGF